MLQEKMMPASPLTVFSQLWPGHSKKLLCPDVIIYICSMHFIMPCKLHAVTDVKKAEPGRLFSQREHIIN